MKWESIQDQWQSTNSSVKEAEIQQWVQDAKNRERTLHRAVRRRDTLETGIAVLLVPFFGYFAWSFSGKGMWLAAFAATLLVGCCLYIPWRLRQARKLLPDPERSTDMLVYLHAELAATEAQHRLLKGILGWYLGPLGGAVILLYFGVQGWSLSTLYYTLSVLVLYGMIYLLNQKAAVHKMAPRIEQIEKQIRELSC